MPSGAERDVERRRRDLPAGCACLAGELDDRVAGDERVLERLAVGAVLQVDVAAAQRLQAAGARRSTSVMRELAAQLQRLDPLLVGAQMRDRGVGLDAPGRRAAACTSRSNRTIFSRRANVGGARGDRRPRRRRARRRRRGRRR